MEIVLVRTGNCAITESITAIVLLNPQSHEVLYCQKKLHTLPSESALLVHLEARIRQYLITGVAFVHVTVQMSETEKFLKPGWTLRGQQREQGVLACTHENFPQHGPTQVSYSEH